MSRLVSKALLLLACLGTGWQQPVLSQTAEKALFTSRAYVATSTKEDHFEDTMSLKSGAENQPLTLVVRNGGQGKVGFNWFRINVAGYLLATEKNMDGRPVAAVNVNGQIQPGGGQILIDAAGEPGATLSFSLETPSVSLSAIQPSTAQPGQAVVLRGTSFSSTENQNAVFIGNTPMPVLSAGANAITAEVPPNISKGTYQVKVVVNGVESDTRQLQVAAFPAPTLTSTNYWMAPPGAQLVITGQNFAPTAAENVVYFKNVKAQIVNATSESITVIVPQWAFGPQQLNIPLYVVSRGVRSSNALRFDFGPKYEGQLPPMPGGGYSEASF